MLCLEGRGRKVAYKVGGEEELTMIAYLIAIVVATLFLHLSKDGSTNLKSISREKVQNFYISDRQLWF